MKWLQRGINNALHLSMKPRNRFSLIIIFSIGLIYLFSLHKYKMWETGIVSGGDSWGYYLYLPATIIHHDLDNLKTSVQTRLKYHPANLDYSQNPLGVLEVHPTPEGKQVNKYTVGVAIFQLPFFLLAHMLAILLHLPADGYSFIYIYLIHLAGVFYALAGFFILRKVLLHFVSDRICALTLLAISIGTNLYYFTVYNSGMAHAYLFMLYCVLIYFTIKWYQNFNWPAIIGISLSAGFITMIRPTEIICILIPVLWGIQSFRDIPGRFALFRQQLLKISVGAGFFILAGLPQLIYWKLLSGHFLYYSYTNEGFDFLHPHIKDGLLSYKNGWLAYTPIMYFALTGIFLLKRKNPALFPIVFFLPIHIYLIYSWWCWNYINGFGSRPMVETYALLSIPLAFTFKSTFVKGRLWLSILVAVASLFFIFLNLFNTYQFSRGVLWTEDANWQYYKNLFGKTKLDYLDLVRYDNNLPQPDEDNLRFVKEIGYNNFEDSISKFYSPAASKSGRYGFTLNPEIQFGPGMENQFRDLDLNPGDWLKISIDAKNKNQNYNLYQMNILGNRINRNGKDIYSRYIRIDNKVGNPHHSLWGGQNNVWGTAYYWIKIPEKTEPTDILKTYTKNLAAPEINIDNLTIQLWREKE